MSLPDRLAQSRNLGRLADAPAAPSFGGRSMFLLVAFAASVALTPAALADDIGVPEQIVGVMNQLWGSHKGVRADHAKGVVLEGRFTPSKDGAILSSAPLFTEPSVPVTVRFSDSTGVQTSRTVTRTRILAGCRSSFVCRPTPKWTLPPIR